jgi:hypothetical protein
LAKAENGSTVIGYGALPAGTRRGISKNISVAGIRYSREASEAIATSVKMAGICTSDVKAEELDGPLAGGAGVVGGSVPTAGAAAAECVIGGGKESDKSSRASSAGYQGFGVGRKMAVGISVKRGAGIVRVGAVKETVGKGADTAKMVEGGRKEKHILVNERLDDGRVGRAGFRWRWEIREHEPRLAAGSTTDIYSP